VRCLVTGASGFVGSWLVRRLLADGHPVTAFMRESPATRRNADWFRGATVVLGSLEDLTSLRASLGCDSIDVVFHLAWFGVASEFRNHTDQIPLNVTGTLRLWELARDAGCKHWIGLGSQAEYGPCAGILREGLPANPVTAYGVAKLASGMLTSKMAEMAGMRHTWLRLLAVYGPGDDPRHLIPSLIQTLCSGKKPSLTKAEQVWDYLYVGDAVDALSRIATTGATGIFNLASGKTVQIGALAKWIRDMIDPQLPLGIGEVPYLPDQVMHLEADISRLRAAIGWRAEMTLEEGLRQTVEGFKTSSAHVVNH
jgi:UDP-glucose 4-epimerase